MVKGLNFWNKPNDEFYTRYEDIEKEISCYNTEIFRDKIIYCNCDDENSNFVKYFCNNFERLGLKECWYSSDNCFSFKNQIKLKKADIIITNPPFSLKKHFITYLIDMHKNFIIVCHLGIVVNSYYIPYFRNKQIRGGYNSISQYINNDELKTAPGFWFTNFPIVKNNKKLKIMSLKEIPDKYKYFDDNNVLVVDNNYIPNDYNLSFAVSARPILYGLLDYNYKIERNKRYDPIVNGKSKFARVLVSRD